MNQHPGKILKELLKSKSLTQRQFAQLIGKKVSEVNELINSKRNITVQWDILLSHFLGTEPKYWLNLQNDYDYQLAQESFDKDLFEKNKLEHEASEILDKKPIEIASDSYQKINKKEEKKEALSSQPRNKEINSTEIKQPQKTANKSQDISKENQNNKKEKILSQRSYNLNKEDNLDKDSENLQKIEKSNSLSKQKLSNLDSGRNPNTTSGVGPELQDKKDKYFYQMIYRDNDKFDSYFPQKKEKKHGSKSINIDQDKKNKSLSSNNNTTSQKTTESKGQEKNQGNIETLKQGNIETLKHGNNIHKKKEHIFRNF